MLTVKIPDAQFAAGGLFFGQNPARVNINIPLVSNTFGLDVTKEQTNMEDWELRPKNGADMRSLLTKVKDGLIEFRHNGAIATPEQLITLFQTYWQEL